MGVALDRTAWLAALRPRTASYLDPDGNVVTLTEAPTA